MIEPGYRSEVTGAWPIVESASDAIQTAIRSRSVQGGTVSTSTPRTRAVDGFCPHKVDNWMHSVRTTIPSGVNWDNAQGVMVRAQRTGRR